MPRALRRIPDPGDGPLSPGAAGRKSLPRSGRATKGKPCMGASTAHHSARHPYAFRLPELPRTSRALWAAHPAPGSALLPAMPCALGGNGPAPFLSCNRRRAALLDGTDEYRKPMTSRFTRRELFSLFARPFQQPAADAAPPAGLAKVAVIQGRHCVALTSFCASCVERCPVPDAMQVTRGMPMVVADACTGCGICHAVCPAPVNAVLMLPRRRTQAQVSNLATT
jgi:Na+-translocating ferredoxin:NAD+ oxidoreductase RNF subunit RnfB